MSTSQEIDQLYNVVNADAVSPGILERLKDFSVESKNQLVARIAQTFEPAPPATVLARLLFILTEENRSDVMTAFLVNLRSPYSDARKASLFGLERLEHPGIVDFALNSLRDDEDQVLVAACDILVRKAKEQPQIWELLKSFYAAHKGRENFYGITNLLEAHGINTPEPSR